MNIFKNYTMALAALAIVAGSLTVMSFNVKPKASQNAQEFGMQVINPGQVNWIPLAELEENVDYSCTPSSNTCKGLFEEHQIDPNTNRPYEGQTPASTTSGNFDLL